MSEDGVLAEYLLFIKTKPINIKGIFLINAEKHMCGYLCYFGVIHKQIKGDRK